jgi:hypothetical protein
MSSMLHVHILIQLEGGALNLALTPSRTCLSSMPHAHAFNIALLLEAAAPPTAQEAQTKPGARWEALFYSLFLSYSPGKKPMFSALKRLLAVLGSCRSGGHDADDGRGQPLKWT